MNKLNFRFFLVTLGVSILFAMLVIRLVDVQLIRGHHFLSMAEDNRFFQISRPGDRGVIVDRLGRKMVWNERVYGLVAQPQVLYSKVTPIEANQAFQVMATDSARIQTLGQRNYAYPEALAHVLGYVGPVSADDLEARSDLALNQNLGKLGLEKWFDQQLQGKDGVDVYEVNAQANRQRLVSQTQPEAGQALETTLDKDLSAIAYQALGEQRGAVVILDAQSGDVLTLVSKPSFDPSLFNQQIISDQAKQQRQLELAKLTENEYKPFFNRAAGGVYPPGSVFKIVTALAGLDQQVVDTQTTVLDEGVLKVGEYEYGNWYFSQFGKTEGEIGLVRAISRSNDIFFYKVAEWVGPDKLAQTARLLGFGEVTGLELGAQGQGLVPDPAWKEQVIGEKWYLGNTYHFGIGQGDMLVSPVQVAQAIQAVANDGVMCRPSLIGEGGGRCSALGISEDHLSIVLSGMIDACSPGGTAFPFFNVNEERGGEEGASVNQNLARGMVACKTGTAEFGGADSRGYRKTHGWWVGIVEPRIPEFNENELVGGVAGEVIEEELVEEDEENEGGEEGQYLVDKANWRQQVASQGYPRRLVVVVLVESDDDEPFKEGSKDAAPVGKEVLDWLESK